MVSKTRAAVHAHQAAMPSTVNQVGKFKRKKPKSKFEGSCMTPVTANLDTSFQSLIFVISLKSSMAYDLYMLMGSIPTLVFDYNNFAPGLVKNFIVTTFLQNGKILRLQQVKTIRNAKILALELRIRNFRSLFQLT